MQLSPARHRFITEIRQPSAQIDLAKATLYIAQEEYPELDVEMYLAQLDAMAEAIAPRIPAERYPLRVIQSINAYLYEELGFSGNEDEYYNPRNSFLNDVLDRRTGIPISLSLVYLEIARRLKFPMVGIGMPAHFIIRPDFEGAAIFVDAFHGGKILFEDDCRELLSKLYGQPVELQPSALAPIDAPHFLARVLTNLKVIYLQQGDLDRLLRTIERILLLFPNAPVELRDRGLLYFQQNRWMEARSDLERYIDMMPTSRDAPMIQSLLDRLQNLNFES
ncbi:MAG: tetratricopeptide repeat protein [Cyanobacteria bacterium J06648_11]